MTNSNDSLALRNAAWMELAKRHPDDPYAWAMAHRTMGTQPLRHLPALADIARDTHPMVVIQKSAQVGVTELLVNMALWCADTGHADRGNALFLMPTANQTEDFAQARFDQAIQDSAYLRARLQPEPPRRKGADSKRLKRIGPGYIFLRGAESTRQVASVPADVVLLDEYDQMADGILELAQKRLSSSRRPLLRVASTPRFPETGINGLYLQSDQRRYYLPCLHCGLSQPLTWEANVDLDRALVVCRDCRQQMDVLTEGAWIAEAPGNERIHGYHLNRLYSPWANIAQMIEASTATTPSAVQEFQNSDLGETFVPPGGGLSANVLDDARCDYELSDYAGEPCVMGVDVGIKFHVVIREDTLHKVEKPTSITWQRENWQSKLWFAGEVSTLEELHELRRRYHVGITVIDAFPETHLVREFAAANPESIWLARYVVSGAEKPELNYSPPREVVVNRLVALDATFERFRKLEVRIPCAARELGGRVREGLGEYYREMLAQRRTLQQDANGNWRANWVDGGRADHYAHAELYCWLADRIADSTHGAVFFLELPVGPRW